MHNNLFFRLKRRHNIMWQSVSVTCDRSVVFSGFLHQLNWPPRYNWNIVESGIKHHKPNQPIIMYLQERDTLKTRYTI
jgi:hypothetical protein